MKWFFLFFLILFAVLGNLVAFDTDTNISLIRAFGGLTFNLLAAALLLIWKASYFDRDQFYQNSKDLGVSLMFLSFGLGFVGLGLDSALENSCDNLYPSEKGRKKFYKLIIKTIADFFKEQEQCYLFGIGVTSVGFYVSYLSFRILIKNMKQPN